jgi:hypothetical protein
MVHLFYSPAILAIRHAHLKRSKILLTSVRSTWVCCDLQKPSSGLARTRILSDGRPTEYLYFPSKALVISTLQKLWRRVGIVRRQCCFGATITRIEHGYILTKYVHKLQPSESHLLLARRCRRQQTLKYVVRISPLPHKNLPALGPDRIDRTRFFGKLASTLLFRAHTSLLRTTN